MCFSSFNVSIKFQVRSTSTCQYSTAYESPLLMRLNAQFNLDTFFYIDLLTLHNITVPGKKI